MPAVLSYPGVYVEEVSSGVRTIVGVATSVTAFIGRAKQGPVNEPTTVNSFADFERLFGGLWELSYLGFAVRDYFQNGGSQAVIVRLFHPIYDDQERVLAKEAAQRVADIVAGQEPLPDSTPKSMADKASDAAAAYENDVGAKPEQKAASKEVAERAMAAALLDMDAAREVAKSARTEANLVDERDALKRMVAILLATAAEEEARKSNSNPVKVVASINGAKSDIEDTATEIETAAMDANPDTNDPTDPAPVLQDVGAQANTYTTEPQKAIANYLKSVASSASPATYSSAQNLFQTEAAKILAASTSDKVEASAKKKLDELKTRVRKAAADSVNGAAPLGKARIDWDTVNTLKLEAASEGGWGNSLRIRVDHDTKDSSNTDLFNLTVRDVRTGATEIHRNLSVTKSDARYVGAVLKSESDLVRLRPDLTNPLTTRPQKHGDPPAGTSNPFDDKAGAAHSRVAEQSSDGGELHEDDFTGTGKEAKKEGLYALENADLFNLLCIPPYKMSNGEAEDVHTDIWSQAATYCEKRRAILIIDPPKAWNSKKDAVEGMKDAGKVVGTVSKNAAVFFPRLIQPNPLRERQMEHFVPCGAVAGVFARTDATRGVWKAPAGLEAMLNGVPELSVSLTDAENGELNPLGLNCLRTMAPAGRVVWGARTLQGDDRFASEWKYIPVRRTALFIEETLYRNLRWVVFEPNDEPLWAQIRLNVGAFMQDLFRQGAFQGQSPREAYFVRCSSETTTQSDINRGVVNIWVGFKPLKPAEFVVIKLQQMAGQIQT